ncbi:MAG: tRNA 2-thiocytidine biosynthesis protein TtcA [Clostridia bacterium]|nr:tRNA 2-thiocytidine biosynthesis protein TtcA [Clostridia bacterium]
MQMLMSHIRAALQRYNMIEAGDKIAVGVSGGKDSLALLYALSEMRRFYPIPYELVAITLDMQFGGKPADFSKIQALCDKLGVEYIIRPTQLAKVIFEDRKEKNPCSLCAKMRRGMLHDAAKEAGCNKLALGHHLDDAVVTFYMNLLDGGKIGCFRPVSYLSRKDLTLIRPMVFAYERDVSKAARKLDLPVTKSLCKADGITERQRVKDLLNRLEKENGYSSLYQKTIGALQRGGIDGWE